MHQIKETKQSKKNKRTKDCLEIVLLNNNHYIPCKSTKHSAGYDLSSPKDYILKANSILLVPLDFKAAIPVGYYGQLASRSGLALKQITVAAGVIDSDYRGNICVLLYNNSNDDLVISAGQKIAQLIIIKILSPIIKVCESLNQTERNENGFGSTGP